MEKLVILTGAGMSAESGIKTFRDDDGLWENHDIQEVATPQAFKRDPEMVLRFYNERRKDIEKVEPNQAHKDLVKLEEEYNVSIITQNIDNLHERARSSDVHHLHGEIMKMRSSADPSLIYPYEDDIKIGDTCEKGSQLRPHVVWFGEAVPMISEVQPILRKSDKVIIIGTSMQVYPAAALIDFAPDDADVYYIDPAPSISPELARRENLRVIESNATSGVAELVDELM